MDKKRVATLVALWLVLFAVMYIRPLPIYEILPDFADMFVTECTAEFCIVEAGEDGKPVYKDVTKRFDLADRSDLLQLLREEKYRQKLASAFYGGYRPPETQPYPRTELRLVQGDTTYEVCVYPDYLVMGTEGALRDFVPVGKEEFTAAIMAFARDRGEIVATEVREFSSAAGK